MSELTVILLLVALATVVATGARRWSLPAPSVLVVVGVLVGLLPFVPDIAVSPEVISVGVLPPLLYASAEEISARDLKQVWRPVTVLAIGLVLATAVAVAVVARLVSPLSGGMAFVLGAVLASTDPVAVTALGRRLSLPPRIQVMVQSESLFNDATSLVLFKVAVGGAVAAGAFSLPHAVGQFGLLAGGGAAIGAAVAGVVMLIRRRTEDPVLETVIALVTPYAAYVLAEDAHTSGVMGVVVAGVILGGTGHRLTNAQIRLQVHAVYDTVVFLLESVVFAVIGLELPSLIHDLRPDERGWAWGVLAVAATVIALRMLWVFPMTALMARRRGQEHLSWRVPMVVTWAGTRGVMPLAAALTIPLAAGDGLPLPHRSLVLVMTTGVVVLTLVLQGFSLAPVVRRSGIALEPEATAREQADAEKLLAAAGLAELEQLAELDAAPDVVVDQLRRGLTARIEDAAAGSPDTESDRSDSLLSAHRELRRALIAAETAELRRLYASHRITDATRRRLQRTLDLEEAGLGD
ncbi:Na+/H+ antiporter [Phaeacidiphilus oryzae]|uniref:Na+/H+ antiporter n=1 Tax=Phaeacidiphilus oryzae TaxID=348818 RepID=UPI000569244E|nr:Na+/H+ antiporter [Phaeacidiphilus oryzae]